jgi:hypothetical protein
VRRGTRAAVQAAAPPVSSMPKERPSCAAALVQVSGMRQNENIVNLSVLRTRTAVTSARATYRAATHLPDNQRTCERGILQAGSGRLLAVPQLDCLLAIGRDTFKASSALRDEPQLSTSKWATTGDCAASVSRHIQGFGRSPHFIRSKSGRSIVSSFSSPDLSHRSPSFAQVSST